MEDDGGRAVGFAVVGSPVLALVGAIVLAGHPWILLALVLASLLWLRTVVVGAADRRGLRTAVAMHCFFSAVPLLALGIGELAENGLVGPTQDRTLCLLIAGGRRSRWRCGRSRPDRGSADRAQLSSP
jgi:hypothetical protein